MKSRRPFRGGRYRFKHEVGRRGQGHRVSAQRRRRHYAVRAGQCGRHRRHAESPVIVRYGIGVNNVDLRAAAARGIPVCNVPDYCIDEVADHALAMILDLTRKITANHVKVKSGSWGLAVPLGPVGLEEPDGGHRRLRPDRARGGRGLVGFKCRLLVYDPVVDAAAVRSAGCEPAQFETLLSDSDLITLHCPSTRADAADHQCPLDRPDEARRHAGQHGPRHAGSHRRFGGGPAERPVSAAAVDVTDPEPPDLPARS